MQIWVAVVAIPSESFVIVCLKTGVWSRFSCQQQLNRSEPILSLVLIVRLDNVVSKEAFTNLRDAYDLPARRKGIGSNIPKRSVVSSSFFCDTRKDEKRIVVVEIP